MRAGTAQLHSYCDAEDCLLVLDGEIDIAVTGPLLQNCLDVVASTTASLVGLDLSRVTFLDASGLALLLRLADAVRSGGKSLRLLGVSACIRRVFDICELTGTFGLAASIG